jgi:para-aminobenzoate synthetase/4-amino-4-deoxychorismate lyase
MPDSPTIFLDSFSKGNFASSWRFDDYVRTVAAGVSSEVSNVLKEVEEETGNGLYAVGYVSYEAAKALNQDLPAVQPVEGLPLAWFALFRKRYHVDNEKDHTLSTAETTLKPVKKIDDYADDVRSILEYIANGDCYQVNCTFPLKGTFSGNPLGLYHQIAKAQQASFSAYIDTGRFTVLSASPELFFSVRNGIITTRPMKGTAKRGRWSAEDLAMVEKLLNSPKERAENLMIVDLLRNDLGIVAETGSVFVDKLFEVETYPTVHQMTSTISARLIAGKGIRDIFKALFPCGSVTGAPKKRSMEIITELEGAPRGVYCGAIGYVAPGGEAVFSVAIRTMLFDKMNSTLNMGVGSGITWDSIAEQEYDESISKGAFINQKLPDFQLIESFRLEKGEFAHLERHIVRLSESARYFGFSCDENKIRLTLADTAANSSGLCKVRLLLAADGSYEISSEPLNASDTAISAGVSKIRTDSSNIYCYHKTTRREIYDIARSNHPGCEEVLLLNEHGQLTEGSFHNLVLKIDGKLVTPPLTCGLLPGVLREELFEQGTISERIMYPEDLKKAEEIWLINSVRGWRRCNII